MTMTYIKKMVMQGFKSFARKTEIPFENSMNVIVGPNGSGKSNITDALCFVLGRLSIKSIRAAKAANLLFTGNKTYKGATEASIELIFDNEDKSFSIDSKEISIKRIVRNTGTSIYKINNQTKTRQDLLELLSQAGIDPNGFNIVLQGEIQDLVKSTPEDRRKIIEEVAGISIYETRKQKSLRELEKTEERLKEVSAVLRERNSYLKNLDKEREEALTFQKLDETIKKCKASLMTKDLRDKEKEIWGINKIIENFEKEIVVFKEKVTSRNSSIEKLNEEITLINRKIQSSTSNEQEELHRELSDLKAELAGLEVRRENFENRIESGKEKVVEIEKKIKSLNEEVSNLRTSSPKIKEQQQKRKELQENFDLLESQRRKFYILRSELSTLENQKLSFEKFLIESKKESQLIEQNISSLYSEIKYAKSIEEIRSIRKLTEEKINENNLKLASLEKGILVKEKENAVFETEIIREEKMAQEIIKLDSCPVCKQKVEGNHKHEISTVSNDKISNAKKIIEENKKVMEVDSIKIEQVKSAVISLRKKLNELDMDNVKIKNADERKEQIKRIISSRNEAKEDLDKITQKIISLKGDVEKIKNVEAKYDEIRLKLQEFSFVDLDSDTEISLKDRELNRLSVEVKSFKRDVEDSSVELKKIESILADKEKILEKKEAEEQKLYEKFQKFFSERNELQDKQKVLETDLIGFEHTIRNLEEKINHNKIQRAQVSAQIDSLKTEIASFGNIEILQIPLDQIKDRLQKSQFRISRFGSVNMRALEVFDKVKEQVVLIQEKVNTIEVEKEKIKQIILEIDKKKKKSFMTTLNQVNEYFSRNFSALSRKSEVFLELENKKDPFEGGLNILVKISTKKYFDIASLSGGEKTMVALALIFAIQEYRPYSFYIFDEIDAALDKHNSELLAALIKKYMASGQYLVITHNDTLITEASNLYGVSMQENISKIVSLKV